MEGYLNSMLEHGGHVVMCMAGPLELEHGHEHGRATCTRTLVICMARPLEYECGCIVYSAVQLFYRAWACAWNGHLYLNFEVLALRTSCVAGSGWGMCSCASGL
eukprot:9705795-Alexandrium_andersonii.AAC.1